MISEIKKKPYMKHEKIFENNLFIQNRARRYNKRYY